MTNVSTQWRITVAADTARARSELKKFASTAQAAGMSMEQVFANVKGAPVARTFNNVGRELNKMNAAVQKGKVHMGQWNKYWQNSNNLIRYSKQLQFANSIAIEKTNGTMTSATAIMKRFGQVTVSTTEKLAYMNTFFRAASRQSINMAKNIQWAGRQITVGFGVPFGLAMTGAAMSFFKFEEQVVRFRKVFNEEMSDMNIEEAEERIVSLANTMATSLGVARDEVLETSALFAQMGYGVEEIERLTEQTTRLALLGETNAEDAGKLLRAYSASGFVDTFVRNGGSETEFEEYITNMLNMIENNTGLSIASMVESGMAQLIPLFSQMGVGAGIGESILAGMTEALGGRTSEAVTALKAIMQRVYDESAETTEQFGFLGVDIEGLQERYKSDFVGLITELGDILANNPAIQGNNLAVAETFGNLFGVRQANRAIAGLRAVSSAFDESGEAANDYGRALEAIQDPQEAAARSAAEVAAQAESIGGQFRRLKEAILIEAAEIGESFLELIMPLVKGIRSLVEWFGDLSTGAKNMAMGFGLAVVAVGGILTSVGVLIQAVLYMARTIGFFLPKFKTWTEEGLKNRIATDHLNESLKSQRAIIEPLEPMWESLSQAMRESTTAVNSQVSALERLGRAQANAAGMNPADFKYLPGHVPAETAAQEASRRHRQNRKDSLFGGRNSDAGLARVGMEGGAARMGSRQRQDYIDWWERTGQLEIQSEQRRIRSRSVRRDGSTALGRRTSLANQRILGSDGSSSVKWRGGMAGAGAMLGMGGMFVGGRGGDAMFGASMGMEGIAMLANKNTQKAIANISEGLLNSARHSKALGGALGTVSSGLKTSAASVLTMGGGIPVITAAIAAVAGVTYLISKNLKESAERANALANEFQYAATLGEEFGLQLENTTGQKAIIGGAPALDPDEFEDASDSIKSVVADIQRVNASGGDAQRVFRNIAREWLEGGATIEQVNDALNNLEAQIGVEITSVNSDLLQQTLANDIVTAMEASATNLKFDTTLWNDIFGDYSFFGLGGTDTPFGDEGLQEIQNRVAILKQGMDAAMTMDPEGADRLLSRLEEQRQYQLDIIDGERNKMLYTREYVAELSKALGIPDEIAEGFDEAEDAMSFYYNSLVTDQNYLNSLTDEQRQTLFEIVRETESWEGHASQVYTAFNDMGMLSRSVRNETKGIAMEVGRLAGYEGADTLRDVFDVVRTGDMQLLERYISGLEDLHGTLEQGSAEARILKAIIDRANAAIAPAGPGAGHYAGMAAAYSRGHWGGPPKTSSEEDTTSGAAEAAEDDVKSYVSSFRSELDNRRNEIIQSILDAFDEASDARKKALEEEQEERLALLEEQRDAELEAIRDQRDAELEAIDDRIEAIDDYIDKQKEIQDALKDQIDLNVALASGDRGKAAQIQNAMQFGTLGDMANSEKDRLGDVKDAIDEEYDEREERRKEYYDGIFEGEKEAFDLRMEQEETYRQSQRDKLEESLEGLENMYLGSEAAWNNFYNKAVGKATSAGVSLERGLENGFFDAMRQIEREMDIDAMWENASFPNLERVIKTSIERGFGGAEPNIPQAEEETKTRVTSGIRRGVGAGGSDVVWDGWMSQIEGRTRSGITGGTKKGVRISTGEAYWDSFLNRVMGSTEDGIRGGTQSGIKEVNAALDAADRGDWDTFARDEGRSSSDSWQRALVRHSGGPVGGGAPKDVPAVLQTGEYVIQRSAVKSLGTDYLDQLNNYHSGGFVGVGEAIGEQLAKKFYDPEPGAIGPIGSTGGKLVSPDSSRVTNYGGWTSNLASGVAEKFAKTLAALPGGQLVTSAYRSESHNSRVGGSPNSRHVRGKAVDFVSKTNNSLSNLDRMGRFFEGKPGVYWVGRPGTDPGGGHNDHVHVSYYHGGGAVSLAKGGRLKQNNVPAMLHRGETVLRAPVAKSLEQGIASLKANGGGGGDIHLHIDNFHGTEENIDRLADAVQMRIERHHRKVNASRRIG